MNQNQIEYRIIHAFAGIDCAAQLCQLTAEFPERPENEEIFGKTGNYSYLLLGLVSEVGELAGEVKRRERGDYDDNQEDFLDRYRSELFDCLWYLLMLIDETGGDTKTLLENGFSRLLSRKARGTIKGRGQR